MSFFNDLVDALQENSELGALGASWKPSKDNLLQPSTSIGNLMSAVTNNAFKDLAHGPRQ